MSQEDKEKKDVELAQDPVGANLDSQEEPTTESTEETPVEAPEESEAVQEDTVSAAEDESLPEDVLDWTTEQLLKGIRGELETEVKAKDLVKVYRQREELDMAWTHNQAIAYLRSGEEPAKTTTGAWLVDVTRSERTADEWSTAELEAWARDEIQAGGRTHPNGVAIELKARLSLKAEDNADSVRKAYAALSSDEVSIGGAEASEPVVVKAAKNQSEQLQASKAVVAQIEHVEGLTPMNVAFIDDVLERYIDTVKPGRVISEGMGLKAQNELDSMLQYVVSLDAQGILAGMERIKPVFKKQMAKGGVFEASNVFRFTHLMRTENNRAARHIGLLEAMRVFFSDVKEARKQVDLRSLLQFQPTDKIDVLVEYLSTRA